MSDQPQNNESILEEHVREEMIRYARIEDRLTKIENQLGEITSIWQQAKGALTFIKIMASITSAVAAIYVFITSNFSITPK